MNVINVLGRHTFPSLQSNYRDEFSSSVIIFVTVSYFHCGNLSSSKWKMSMKLLKKYYSWWIFTFNDIFPSPWWIFMNVMNIHCRNAFLSKRFIFIKVVNFQLNFFRIFLLYKSGHIHYLGERYYLLWKFIIIIRIIFDLYNRNQIQNKNFYSWWELIIIMKS